MLDSETLPCSPDDGPALRSGPDPGPTGREPMAKQKYYLDTRVLTAFFFAAMPFVAFGSFIVVNMAKNQLRDSVGVGLEQRAVQTKLAIERHIGPPPK